MKTYIYSLSQSDKLPTNIIFMNGGVNIACEGSNCIESLKILQDKNVKISSCGACLDYFGLKEKLSIGAINNMYSIVDLMNSADKVIKLRF